MFQELVGWGSSVSAWHVFPRCFYTMTLNSALLVHVLLAYLVLCDSKYLKKTKGSFLTFSCSLFFILSLAISKQVFYFIFIKAVNIVFIYIDSKFMSVSILLFMSCYLQHIKVLYSRRSLI